MLAALLQNLRPTVRNECPLGQAGGGAMLKSELIAVLTARYPHISQRQIESSVAVLLASIAQALATGRRVELRGFGSLSLRIRPSRVGLNPRTGQAVSIQQKRVPCFRTGKQLRLRLNAPPSEAMPAEIEESAQ